MSFFRKIIYAFSLFFISNLIIAQEANHVIYPPDNEGDFKSLDSLLYTADSLNLDSISLFVENLDVSVLSSPFVDLSYFIDVSLNYQSSTVLLPALLKELELLVSIRIEGSSNGNSYLLEREAKLMVSPIHDKSTASYHISPALGFPFKANSIESIKVTALKSQLDEVQNEAFLESIFLDINVDRIRYFFPSNIEISPEIYTYDQTDTSIEIKKNEAFVHWSKVDQPALYEIEMLHIPHKNPGSVSQIEVDFRKNASRYLTKYSDIPIGLLYEKGFLVVRGRTKRPLINADSSALIDKYIYSDWSLNDSSALNTSSSNVLVIGSSISNIQDSLNWQVRSQLAIDGKRKDVTSFFDGSKRDRQTSTVLYDNKYYTTIDQNIQAPFKSTVVANENVYDYNGNTILSILPAPLYSSNDISFQKGINFRDADKIRKSDYDSTSLLNPGSNPYPLSDSEIGASNYYSQSNNEISAYGPIQYIPDADGYPFKRTEFLKDGSGRIKVDYGLGSKADDATKGSQYAYVRANRQELESLFGSNIGISSFYKKDIVIDPNGVMNISYKDQNDRVVASAISGIAEGRSNMVNLPFSNNQIEVDLLNSGAEEYQELQKKYELSYPFYVSVGSTYSFNYGFELDPYVSCQPSPPCYNCRYDFEMQILDQDNKLITRIKDTIDFSQSDCNSDIFGLDDISLLDTAYNYVDPGYSASISSDSLLIDLPARKQFTITKTLSLITDSIPLQALENLNSESCELLDLQYFENDELNQLNFDYCENYYDLSGNDYCEFIYNNLRKDFLFPEGHFVKEMPLDLSMFDTLAARLRNTFSCNRFSIEGCFGDDFSFQLAIKNKFGINHLSVSDSQAYALLYPKREEIADYLVQFHPNWCQYEICMQKYSGSGTFENILNRSDNLDDFVAMASQVELFDPDSVEFKWNNTDSAFIAILLEPDGSLDTLYTAEALYEFDPVIKFDSLTRRDSTERYNLCGEGTKQGYAYYSSFIFENFVKPCLPHLQDTFDRKELYDIYFDLMVEGCYPDSSLPDTASLYKAVKGVAVVENLISEKDTSIDHKWLVFRQLYLTIRDRIMEDMISSLVCVKANNYRISNNCNEKTDTSIYPCGQPMEGGEPFGDTTCVGCLPINLACSSDVETRYWSTAYSRASSIRDSDEIDYDSLLAKKDDSMLIHKAAGNQVYQLLKYYSCYSGTDSSTFINSFNAFTFVCSPFSYINSLGVTSCDIDSINLASIQTILLEYGKDSANVKVPYFKCDLLDFKDVYLPEDINSANTAIQSILPQALPTLMEDSDLNIYSHEQRAYANYMNAHLALNLGFADYYYFFKETTLDSNVTPFGDSVFWNGTQREKEIKEVALSNVNQVNYKEISNDSLLVLINEYLASNSYDTIPHDSDYLALGEESFQNGQYDLFYFKGGKIHFEALIDTFNLIFNKIRFDLGSLGTIEYNNTANGELIPNTHYDTIGGLDSLLIDRSGRFADGTIWVRLVHSSDSSFYDNYYFHYEPYTYYYNYTNINRFDSIFPLFHDEEMQYVNLYFHHFGREYEIVASRERPLGKAKRISKVLFGKSGGPPVYPISNSCEELEIDRRLSLAEERYADYLDSLKGAFINNMIAYCSGEGSENAISNREFKMSYASADRQFTLYYYDQAGNLVQTIPPSGITNSFSYDSTAKSNINKYRAGISAIPTLPQHTKATKYQYNSANQIIKQTTPNGGTTQFWYDQAGRLVLSQNAHQVELNKYSYSRYDTESRIIETGETQINEFAGKNWDEIQAAIILDLVVLPYLPLDSLIGMKKRNDVTKTFYDTSVATLPNNFIQQNLRGRVSTSAYFDWLDTLSGNTSWEYATHYSYDPNGNVKTLFQDFNQEGDIANSFHRFKRIDYAYDVVSGNVLQVYYQMGEEDAFYHRYSYDAENRIEEVETSRDGIIWDRDASYEYYLHGPLAREVLGEQKIQGIDYAYTIEGYLKSINSGVHKADMGLDNQKENVFGKDVFGMALQYNQYDYSPIGLNDSFLVASNTGTFNSDLYNGNISAISQHIGDSSYGKIYEYDQLNRIMSMNERKLSLDSLKWGNDLSGGYKSNYSYDKSGNLISLHRYDGSEGKHMDHMTYNYSSGTDKLASVDDTVSSSVFSNDIDQQAANNYAYDEIGNLVADKSEGICEIQWYPNGKVKRVIRDFPTKERANLHFFYDANGNRIKKSMNFIDSGKTYIRTTYYVRDAQGNTMATYEERDCNLYEGEDSSGTYFYQYSDTYEYYTNNAISQSNYDSVITFLTSNFSLKDELLDEAALWLNQISWAKDSIVKNLGIKNYLNLYPNAAKRIITEDTFNYANYLFTNEFDSFLLITNYQNEGWVNYLIETDSIDDFYNDLDSLFSSFYGSGEGEQHFYNTCENLILDSINNSSLIKNILDLSTPEYDNVIGVYTNTSSAEDQLRTWLVDLEVELAAGNDNSNVHSLIRQIRFLLLVTNFNIDNYQTAFDGLDMSNFYWGVDSLSDFHDEILSNILHHIYVDCGEIVDPDQLQNYQPAYSINWLNDTNGDFLKYLIQTNVASSQVRAILGSYFEAVYMRQWDIYSISTNTIKNYVYEALIHHYNKPGVELAFLNQDSLTRAYINITETITQLANYFKIYHPQLVLEYNYEYDSLFVLNNLAHLTPYQYAQELMDNLSVDFENVSNCSPYQKYLIANQFIIYGSKRLGIMNAKSRQDSTNLFSRKLGEKNYEISDHLGNVVATVSDKKVHPQELVVSGSQNIDTSIGYQAEVTGRYDYYPFGMEMMGRSGDFTNIDYSSDVNELLYDGLLRDCDNYRALDVSASTDDSIKCVTAENLYGQTYIDTLIVDHYFESQAWFGRHRFDFELDLDLGQVIGTVNPSSNYRIQFNVTSQGRYVYGVSPERGDESIEGDPTATLFEIRHSPTKLLTFNYNGHQLDSMANNGLMTFHLRASWGETGLPYDEWARINSIKVFEIHENSATQIAKRENSAYKYGFNGYERDDETSGSGNHYTTLERPYDSRLGRWWKTDPVTHSFQSPYNGFDNNPIFYRDPTGGNADNYLIKSDGSIDVERTDDKTDNFKYQAADGTITDLGTFNKNSNGYVNINSGGTSYNIDNTKESKRYMQPEAFAGFLGASMNYYTQFGLQVNVNQFSTSTGGHSDHGGNGQYIDYRYTSTNGINEKVHTDWSNFDKAKSQFLVNELVRFGYNSTPSDLRGDRYSILTQQGSTTNTALNSTAYYKGHYHHVHLQNFNLGHINEVPRLSIINSSTVLNYSAPSWARDNSIGGFIYFMATGKDPLLPDEHQP